MKTREIQEMIFEEVNIKTSVKQGSGSMKGYAIFSPMFQDGKYPEFPFEFYRSMRDKLAGFEPKPNFFTSSQFHIYGLELDSINYKRERKPKDRHELKARAWGSKNSQLRLDKAAARYAKNYGDGKARYN